MEIVIDFDGTIVDHRYPNIGDPVPYALEYMREFASLGANLILFTMRSEGFLKEAQAYLEANAVPLFGVNTNPEQCEWTSSPKAYGQVYIDDAAFGCPLTHPRGFARTCVDWSVVGPEMMSRLDPTRKRLENNHE